MYDPPVASHTAPALHGATECPLFDILVHRNEVRDDIQQPPPRDAHTVRHIVL